MGASEKEAGQTQWQCLFLAAAEEEDGRHGIHGSRLDREPTAGEREWGSISGTRRSLGFTVRVCVCACACVFVSVCVRENLTLCRRTLCVAFVFISTESCVSRKRRSRNSPASGGEKESRFVPPPLLKWSHWEEPMPSPPPPHTHTHTTPPSSTPPEIYPEPCVMAPRPNIDLRRRVMVVPTWAGARAVHASRLSCGGGGGGGSGNGASITTHHGNGRANVLSSVEGDAIAYYLPLSANNAVFRLITWQPQSSHWCPCDVCFVVFPVSYPFHQQRGGGRVF